MNTVDLQIINRNSMKIMVSVVLMLLCNYCMAQHKSVLPANDFEKAIQVKDVQVLDVRTPDEYKTGHIKQAVNADFQNKPVFAAQVKKLDASRTVFVYCLSGGRSSKAASWLAENGFKEVVNLDGGIVAWKNAGKETVIK